MSTVRRAFPRAAPAGQGAEMHALAAELYPICRSITGDGVRATLARIGREIALEVREVPTGTQVFDWTVPKEWNIRDAWIADAAGRRVVDFQHSNLHVMGYSVPVSERLSLAELKERVITLPEHPAWIPYRTSYYEPRWAFCLSQQQLDGLADGEYEVHIDSSLEDGHLTYGECLLEGETNEEILISCHVCHPSLANDNLSGIAVATALAKLVSEADRRYSYRFLFIPGTIGSITWLARNEVVIPRIRHGLVLTCVGDPGGFTYKRSRRGDTEIDRVMPHVLEHSGAPFELQHFFPYGYDERQYCSPGIDLAVGCLMRTPHGRFPEYHTSADNLDLIRPEQLAGTVDACLTAFGVLERNRTYVNLSPKGEPQLGRRGLYSATGGLADRRGAEMAMLWVLNQSDGTNDVLAIAERAGLPAEKIADAADLLLEHRLLREAA